MAFVVPPPVWTSRWNISSWILAWVPATRTTRSIPWAVLVPKCCSRNRSTMNSRNHWRVPLSSFSHFASSARLYLATRGRKPTRSRNAPCRSGCGSLGRMSPPHFVARYSAAKRTTADSSRRRSRRQRRSNSILAATAMARSVQMSLMVLFRRSSGGAGAGRGPPMRACWRPPTVPVAFQPDGYALRRGPSVAPAERRSLLLRASHAGDA